MAGKMNSCLFVCIRRMAPNGRPQSLQCRSITSLAAWSFSTAHKKGTRKESKSRALRRLARNNLKGFLLHARSPTTMNSPPLTLKSNLTIFLDLPPSCLEFVPFLQNYFVVGTYFLESSSANNNDSTIKEITQKRSGSLNLYRLQNNEMYFFSVESSQVKG